MSHEINKCIIYERLDGLLSYLDGLTKLANSDVGFRCAKEISECIYAIQTVLDMKNPADAINDMRDVQGQPGNWDDSEYMRGLYNGLELASATLEGREPVYKTDTFTDLKEILSECDDEIE